MSVHCNSGETSPATAKVLSWRGQEPMGSPSRIQGHLPFYTSKQYKGESPFFPVQPNRLKGQNRKEYSRKASQSHEKQADSVRAGIQS